MAKATNLRDPTLDIIRIFALFLVVSVHFLLKIGFYSIPVNHPIMAVMTTMRVNFMACVPLFMLLSGYLLTHKTFSRSYYSRIIKIIGIYILASLACIAFKAFYQGENFTVLAIVKAILGFSGANYAWYVNMYIGLFLLAPFLNTLYHHLPSKKHKLLLIGTFVFLTGFSGIIKYIPTWGWGVLYPITYYFIGSFIHEYRPKIKFTKALITTLLIMLANGIWSFYRNHGGLFPMDDPFSSYNSIFTTIVAILIFTTILNIPVTKIRSHIKSTLNFISSLCLGGYLLSWIFDNIFYSTFVYNEPDYTARLKYYPLIVPIIFICSIVASLAINYIYRFVTGLISRIKQRLTTSTKSPTIKSAS